MAFVKGMSRKKQTRVVNIVNKDLDPKAKRSFQKSVLYNHDWFPQVLVVDLRGTCKKMLKAMKEHMMTAVYPWWKEPIQEWLNKDPLRCIPCVGDCKLDKASQRRWRGDSGDGSAGSDPEPTANVSAGKRGLHWASFVSFAKLVEGHPANTSNSKPQTGDGVAAVRNFQGPCRWIAGNGVT